LLIINGFSDLIKPTVFILHVGLCVLIDFNQVIEELSQAKKLSEGHNVLRLILENFGINHIAYFAVNIPNLDYNRPLRAASYSSEWQAHYLQEGYVNIDPAVRAGITGHLPVDWTDFNFSDPLIKKFFGEAQEFKISRTGLSIPIHGRNGEFALFSVTADISESEWPKFRYSISKELMMLAFHFHDWVIRTEGPPKENPIDSLTSRERDCLRWRALGKTDLEISLILQITPATIKFHLENARSKLRAINTVQAVAKAVNHGLIIIP